MATLSFSTAFIADVMDRLSRNSQPSDWFQYLTNQTGATITAVPGTGQVTTATTNVNFTYNNAPFGSLFSSYNNTNSGGIVGQIFSEDTSQARTASFNFRNASGTTLTSWQSSQLTRTIDNEGYAVMSNFPAKIPAVAGTVSDIQIITQNTNRSIVLTVGAPGSGADVEFQDRTLVTSQPWRLDGSIKFRVPISYTYNT